MEIKKTYETVKYMTFRQWKYRIFYTIRNMFIKRKPYIDNCIYNVRRIKLNYSKVILVEDLTEANDILKNKIYSISNRIEKFDKIIDWDMKNEKYRLVCFRINSFRYLLELSNAYKSTGNIQYIKKGFELIDNWIAMNCSVIIGDKWNAYVIADRLMNWIGFISEYSDDNKLHYYSKYIYAQAIELKKSMEFQLGANHLLSEARALMAAGAFINNKKIYEYGKKTLLSEYKIQFLGDGGHYERSISYHVESLQQYFEAVCIMTEIHDNDVYKFIDMIKKSYIFLNKMIGVNGEIPLFNDAAVDYPFYNARDFLSTAHYLYTTNPPNGIYGDYYNQWQIKIEKKSSINWEIDDYMKYTGFIHYSFDYDKMAYSLFFDVGDNGPDSNLGHTHADALSVLLSSKEKNIFVDSGVFTYKKCQERNECRSTKAHNTIEIDGKNSAEIWDAFRVAKRGHSKVDFYNINTKKMVVKASHDGYKKIIGDSLIHNREVNVLVHEGKIFVSDEVECKKSHKAVLRYHIAPECIVKQISSNECLIDDIYLVNISIPLKLVRCKVAQRFGIVSDSWCIESEFNTKKTKKITTIIKIKEKMKND